MAQKWLLWTTLMWEGMDYLFIDEVSMISCKILCRICEALSIAKGNLMVSISFFLAISLNFHLLKKPIFTHISMLAIKKEATTHDQQTVFSKLL